MLNWSVLKHRSDNIGLIFNCGQTIFHYFVRQVSINANNESYEMIALFEYLYATNWLNLALTEFWFALNATWFHFTIGILHFANLK